MKKTILLGLVLSTLMLGGTAWATKGTIGLGVGVAPDYEGSSDNQGVPMVMFNHRYNSGRFVNLMGFNMRVNLLANENYSLGPSLNYRQGRDDVDNSRVDAMRDIDDAFEAGVFGGIDVNNLLLGIEFLADVSNEHEGYTTQATAGYRWKATPELTITPGAFITYADGDYMGTYFSVNDGNRGGSGFLDYTADSGLKDAGISLLANYTPWQNYGIMGVLSYKSLLNDAKDSPLVDVGDDKQMFFGVMGTYRWEN
jgi:outer membrane protein